MDNLPDLLKQNPYPGRGLALGMTPDGGRMVAVYFIMGRSRNSRNRVFVEEGQSLRIEPFDPALVSDPSLIIYHPIRALGQWLIVTNGDQTDTVYNALANGGSFESGLRTRTFEPDAPNWTPRISGLMNLQDGACRLSILKAQDEQGTRCQRHFFEYEACPGQGHFLHTYKGDGNPLPSFAGEPLCVGMPDDVEAFAIALWNSLHADNRVALCVKETPLGGGNTRTYLYNRHSNKEASCAN
ncbi:MAG: inosine monophosphate cyclohydrolase [Clostridiales bacterium]|nr:inosine monophosphate cyclohydrolase [Clostridiales bacterium]